MHDSRIVTADRGPELSRIVAGMWRLERWNMTTDDLVRFVETCIDLGVTTFDHADIYGEYTCEAIFGEALEAKPDLRDRIEIVTKCGVKLASSRRPANRLHAYDTSREHIVTSVDNSLRALRTDRIDVLLIHRSDPLMDAEEVAEAFADLRRDGKVLHFGVSNFTPTQFALLGSRLDAPLVTNQIEVSVLRTEPLYDGTLDDCQRLRVAPMAWSPFAGGELLRSLEERPARVRGVLARIGKELGGASAYQVALAWLLALPSRVLPLLGTGKIERVRAAAAATELSLTRDQWFTILEVSEGREVP
jgi:predicted oxidoreductase